MPAILAAAQCKQCPDIRDVLKTLQQGHEVKQVVVGVIADPALDGDGIVCENMC